jgi:hypothetical protein
MLSWLKSLNPFNKKLVIPFEDINQSGRGPLFIKDRKRLATMTSVKILDENTLTGCSFVGRKIYLTRFDRKKKTYSMLDSINTTYAGETTETDLCDADSQGNIITSNFYLGTFTHYRRVGDKLEFVRDLPFSLGGAVHGVKFYSDDIIAVTVTKGPTGVHFLNIKTLEPVLHVEFPVKTQDACILSDNKMLMLAAHGTPKSKVGSMYHSTVSIVDFDLNKKTYTIVKTKECGLGHFDCATYHNGKVFLTDQFNDCVKVMNPETLDMVDSIKGFDFPHGIDIKYNMLAVSNYGNNTIQILPQPQA